MKINLYLLIFLIIFLFFVLIINIKEGYQNNYILPNIVWSYWDKDELPENISLIVENNKKILNTWNYIIITPSNINEYIILQAINDKCKELGPQKYTNWIRLYLLEKYGGVWMDISIILNKDIDDIYNKSIELNSELSGFKGEHLTTDDNYPVIENWFLMAPKNSEIIHLWKEEYEKAITMGFLNYKKEQISDNINYQKIFGDNLEEIYLSHHGCLQVVLQKRLNRKARLYYEDAKDSMFKIQSDCGWKQDCLIEKINDKSYSKKIPYIKLRGSDREGLDLTKYFQDN